MEKLLIEQLLNSKISFNKIKSIMDNIEKMNKQENLNETTTANINGLRIMTCQGCHKSMFEDKFMLNKTQKRYRPCINCVLRSRTTRQNKAKQPNIDNNITLAICDIEKQNDVKNVITNQDPIWVPTPEPLAFNEINLDKKKKTHKKQWHFKPRNNNS